MEEMSNDWRKRRWASSSSILSQKTLNAEKIKNHTNQKKEKKRKRNKHFLSFK